jgi:CxxC motif-containing protein (DUF1111 family)
MRRLLLVLLSFAAGLLTFACANDASDRAATGPTTPTTAAPQLSSVHTATPGSPLPGLSASQLQLFNSGLQIFSTSFTPATGLGPLFNSSSCAGCHNNPTVGGYGDSVEIHMSDYHAPACNTLDPLGGPVVQQHATPLLEAAMNILKEPNIPGATASGNRSASFVFGLGLLDAVSDQTIKALARNRYPEGVHGRAAILPDGRVGRFGRKATTATLDEFNAGAWFAEMGVTNAQHLTEGTVAGLPLPPGVDPALDPELPAASLSAANAFVKFLAPPAPLPSTRQTQYGELLFAGSRCGSCHIRALPTGNSPIAALRFKRIEAYTDLLLHDLGSQNADICNGVATPGEFRTQPLMGSQFLDMFMHDGFSSTVDEAIRRHGGEASFARDRYLGLNAAGQAALIAFVRSL